MRLMAIRGVCVENTLPVEVDHRAALPVGFRKDFCGGFGEPSASTRGEQPHLSRREAAPALQIILLTFGNA